MAQYKQAQRSAHMSKYRVLLQAFRPAGAQGTVPDASQLCAIEDIIWRENRSGCKKRERGGLSKLKCVILAQ